MNQNAFSKQQQQEAIRRMREMNARSTSNHKKTPPPEPPKKPEPPKSSSILDGLNLPFLDSLKKDGDATLILGILLLLFSEKADKRLLFALIYILF